jgi:hypothetical protein
MVSFLKGGGGIRNNSLIIPLNPPLKKGDLKKVSGKSPQYIYHINNGT